MSIGSRVKALRKSQKMTQVQLADKANMSRSYLADLEGDRYNPSLNTLKAIAAALNIEVSEIIKNNEPDAFIEDNEGNITIVEVKKAKNSPEEEFLEEVVELSDKEVKEKHTFMIDGRELTEEEFQRMIAAVRLERHLRDQQ